MQPVEVAPFVEAILMLFVMLDPASGVGRKVLFIRGETESSLCHRCSDGTGDTCCSDSHTWRTIAAMRTSL